MSAPLPLGLSVQFAPTFTAWRGVARELLQGRVHPQAVSWDPLDNAQPGFDGLVGGPSLSATSVVDRSATDELRVSKAFLRVAAAVACHRSPERWALLYRVLWRIVDGEPSLMEVATDPDVHTLGAMERAVRRSAHKMKAFVRFRETTDAAGEQAYVAWFEPAHLVVERTAGFFVERFPSMRWSILTPDVCAHWDRTDLRFSAGVSRSEAPTGDDLESLWRTYYAHIFNPARLNLDAMRAEMPRRYWGLLPEARLIQDLARDAPTRVRKMIEETEREPETIPADLDVSNAAADPVAFARTLHANARQTRHEAEIRASAVRNSNLVSNDSIHDPGAFEARQREFRVSHHAPEGLVSPNGCPVRLGVAGWTDPSLTETGVFYPDDATTPEARLRYYASKYSLVEVDATYYSLPTRELAQRWVSRTPRSFVFDIKAHALMTGHGTEVHRLPGWISEAVPARLQSAKRIFPGVLPAEIIDEVWRRFLDALTPLHAAGKLGAVLLQFPPWFKPSPESADAIRKARARLGDTLGAVEFRHRDWLKGRIADRTFQLLEELGLAYVMVDAPQGMESSVPPTVGTTSPRLAVVRLHGRRAETWEKRHDVVSERYRYLYQDHQLRTWVLPIVDIALRHQGVHVLFNNNHANYATTNALEMTEMLLGEGLNAAGA